MPQFKLDLKDVEISHLKGSGPGGQNRNKRFTGVRAVHLPTGITVTATERRSQEQNYSAALERLAAKLEAHFHVDPKRYKTRPTRASIKKRAEIKRHASAKKKVRRQKFDTE